MPFNGAGTYQAPSLPGSFNPATVGGSATNTDWNTLLADISTALSTTITKDGQTTVAADIPMATHKITGLGDATTTTDALNQRSALSLFQTQTISGTAGLLDFTTIPATVNNIRIYFWLAVSTSANSLNMRFFNSVGTIDTTGPYYYMGTSVDSGGGGPTVFANNATAILLASSVANSSTIAPSGTIDIMNIQQAGSTQCNYSVNFLNSAGVVAIGVTAHGARNVNGPITGVRLFSGAGVLTGIASLYIGQ